MTPIEDPATVTIPSASTKDTSEHEFVTSGTNSGLNTINSNTTAEQAHNQSQDGQKDTARNSTSHDGELCDRKKLFFILNSNYLVKHLT